jgi:TetR/AcrR family transcriptional repressor of nem operon
MIAMSSAHEATDVRQSILDAAQGLMAARGFSAVGLNEILASARVPKGSFYHYFGSKDAFGDALLKAYFTDYLAEIDAVFADPSLPKAGRLMNYFERWRDTQGGFECKGKCLAVKLAAEVSDLSEAMRLTLKEGTADIIRRLAGAIQAGVADGSLTIQRSPQATAETLYHTWLGASLMVKIVRTPAPFETAMATTRLTLNLPDL